MRQEQCCSEKSHSTVVLTVVLKNNAQPKGPLDPVKACCQHELHREDGVANHREVLGELLDERRLSAVY